MRELCELLRLRPSGFFIASGC